MNDDKVIDVEPSAMAITVADKNMPVAAPVVQQTPAQARIEALANVLYSAYQKASKLELTPEQVKALKADFPDEAFKLGAGGNDQLIYIEHAYLRDRLDEVLGMGQWALVRSRPHWAEEFQTQKGQKAVRLYADCALLIKGCFVSEAIGEMVYYPNNAGQSYADAAEGSETAAFRRCAKKIGVGLQAWKKDFCTAWMQRHRNPTPQKLVYEKPAPAPVPAKPPIKKSNLEEQMEACKNKLIRTIPTEIAPYAWQVMVTNGYIMPTERMEAVSWVKLFTAVNRDKSYEDNKNAVVNGRDAFMEEVQRFADYCHENANTDPNAPPPEWLKAFEAAYAKPNTPPPASSLPKKDPATPFFDVIVPLPRRNQSKNEYIKSPDTIGSLYAAVHDDEESRKRLWWLVEKWEPKGWTKRDGTEMPPSAADHAFRKALDDFKAWHESTHPDDKL